MNRDEYLRLLAEGYDLAFEKGDLEAGAARYAAAFSSLSPGEVGYSDHHGEYAAILQKLNQPDRALSELRRALEAAEREAQGDTESGVVAVAAWALGEHLLQMGDPVQALDVTKAAAATRSNVAALLLVVRAEAFASNGRLAEAKDAAKQAEAIATAAQRPGVRKRLGSLLKGA